MTIHVLTPVRTVTSTITQRRVTPGVVPSSGLITLVDNGKGTAVEILVAIVDALNADGRTLEYVVSKKPSAALPMTHEVRDDVVDRSVMVISGVGDCGACTSCTVHDAVLSAEAGVPSVAVLTEPFVDLARMTVANFGVADFPYLVIDHPIFTRDDEWIAETGRQLAKEILAGSLGVIQG